MKNENQKIINNNKQTKNDKDNVFNIVNQTNNNDISGVNMIDETLKNFGNMNEESSFLNISSTSK